MSSLLKKYLMALSGLVLVGFVIGHMLGNLQMFLGPEWINEYAYKLQHLPYGSLWLVRGFLLLCLVVHVVMAVLLVIGNRRARPEGYDVKKSLEASFAARTMRWSGVILLAFIVYHIAHFTVQATHPEYREMGTRLEGVPGDHGVNQSRTFYGVYDKLTNNGENPDAAANHVHDVYRMVAAGFSHPLVSAFYLISMVLLCMHLSHGIGSMFQSLGLRNKSWRVRLNYVSRVIAVLVFIGYASLPIATLLGAFDRGDAPAATETVLQP